MITAIDTNILLDVFLPDPKFVSSSSLLLREAYDEGALIVSSIVFAELVPQFGSRESLLYAVEKLNVRTSSIDDEVALLAGMKWKEYRRAGGSRKRIISDFLIGAHAVLRAERFLTRDRGFYHTYYPDLEYFDTPDT
jgi:predicted nucleic acid-binding protein